MTSPPGLTPSPSGKKKGAAQTLPGFSGIFKLPPRIPASQNRGNPKVCQAARSSSGNGTTRARHPPTRYPRPADRPGTHPGPPRPLAAAPGSTAHPGPSHICRTAPSSPRPAPLTALTSGGCAKAARPTSNLLPSPPSPAEAPCHLAAGQAGGRGRRGGDGARRGARAWRSQGRDRPLG